MNDSIIHGTTTRGERNPAAKLTREQVATIRSLWEQGWAAKEIAQSFGVGPQCIRRIVQGKTWMK